MITRSKQNWEIGSQVRVGFLTLKVIARVPTPGDGAPDAYFLTNLSGDKLYEFVPHHGLRLTSLDEAERRITEYRKYIERVVSQDVGRRQQAAAISRRFNELFAEVGA